MKYCFKVSIVSGAKMTSFFSRTFFPPFLSLSFSFSPEPKLKFLLLNGMFIIYFKMNALWILKPKPGK